MWLLRESDDVASDGVAIIRESDGVGCGYS